MPSLSARRLLVIVFAMTLSSALSSAAPLCVPPSGSLGPGGQCVDVVGALTLTSSAQHGLTQGGIIGWNYDWSITGVPAVDIQYFQIGLLTAWGDSVYAGLTDFNPPQTTVQPWVVHLTNGSMVTGAGIGPVLMAPITITPEPSAAVLLAGGLMFLGIQLRNAARRR